MVNVFVCGLAGSGKSNLIEKVSEKFGLRKVHTSGLLRQLKEKEMDKVDLGKLEKGTGFWESEEGKEFLKIREKDFSFDKKLDEELLKIVNKSNAVFDSWTLPWLSKNGIKIWLKASLEVRAKRISLRDKLSLEIITEKIKERQEMDVKRYFKLYGYKMGEDFKPFDLVLNTDNLNEQEVWFVVKAFLDKVIKK
ncbi:MAG: cytidylate kinase family protein [archaeon]